MAKICTVCSSGLIRKTIEQQHLAGQSIRSIAADPGVAAAGLHESSLRRHLTSGHQMVRNTWTPDGLDDSEFSASDVVGGVAAGVRRMLVLRDAPGTSATSAIRAQAEARAGLDSLAKAGVVDGERIAADHEGWKKFAMAMRAVAKLDPDAIESLGALMATAKHHAPGEELTRLAESARKHNAAQAQKEN